MPHPLPPCTASVPSSHGPSLALPSSVYPTLSVYLPRPLSHSTDGAVWPSAIAWSKQFWFQILNPLCFVSVALDLSFPRSQPQFPFL